MGGRGNPATRGSTTSLESKYKNINPNYKRGASNLDADGFNNNCVKCAIAFDANMRGNDVEATAFKFGDLNDLRKSKDVEKAFNPDMVYQVGRPKREQAIREIELMMTEDWGKGSRAIIQEQGGGRRHTLNIVNSNGKVIIVDAQSGEQGSVKDMLKGINTKSLKMFRTDNKSIDSEYSDWAYKRRNK